MQIFPVFIVLHCHGLTPAGSQAPGRHSLSHEWDEGENGKCN